MTTGNWDAYWATLAKQAWELEWVGVRRRKGMPPGDWRNFDEIFPGQRARCVCGEYLPRGGGVRICKKCGCRLWVHATVMVEVDEDSRRKPRMGS